MSSNAKRKHIDSIKNETATKKVKFDENNPLKEKRSTTVLELNDDCLEKIFSYLDQKNLMNVRSSAARFRLPTERAYTRNFSKIQTIVSNNRQLMKSKKLLVSFGHCITKLVIEFKLVKVETLLHAIETKCSDKLIELELRDIDQLVAKQGQLGDIGLRTLELFLSLIADKFPNLKCIRFDYQNAEIICPYSIQRHIPSVTTLSLTGSFSCDDLCGLFKLNGQLKSLTINGNSRRRPFKMNQRFVRSLSKLLPQLGNLEIRNVLIELEEGLNRFDLELRRLSIELGEGLNRFENLKSLTFHAHEDRCRDYLLFCGGNIEDLTLSYPLDSNVAAFAADIFKFKKLKRLTLDLDSSLRYERRVEFLHQAFEWSLESVRHTISANGNLQEIVIICGFVCRRVLETLVDEYINALLSQINEAQWCVKKDESVFIFSKQATM